ncbi:hypothetical protein ULG90_16515 [Halopseudomonas pachastrellae]|nr:hypothetical protein ULG90_16515 [Halopseudomonas pachastrellae]
MQFTSLKLTGLALALGFSAATAQAADLTPVTVTTTWYAQASTAGCMPPRPPVSTRSTAWM